MYKEVFGYVYGSKLRPHDAYQWNVEWTIVISLDAPKIHGIASALYKEFAKILIKQGYRCIYGVLVDTNEASFKFHKSLGFAEVGHFENAGYKLGAWRGIRWMVKRIETLENELQKLLKLIEVIHND